MTVFTPLRVPFAGGLTDLKEYAGRFGGVTVSSTVDRGVLVSVEESGRGDWGVSWGGRTFSAPDLTSLDADLVRECALQTGYDGPPLHVTVEVQAEDHSGLGASGAVCVSLVHAFRAARGERPAVELIASDAADVEVERLGGASGYHDPHVCARGGLLHVRYDGADVAVRRLEPPPGFLAAFEDSLLYFETDRRSSTRASLRRLAGGLSGALDVMHDIKALGETTASAFAAGDLRAVAECIGEQQRLKQLLPGAFVDDLVVDVGEKVRALGAAVQFPGGKIGAYAMVCCPDGQQAEIRMALAGLREVRMKLTGEGTRLLRSGG
ncbi:MAG TPA: hypothetical protein VF164_09415 [Trueperaceae bacterium]